MFADAAHSKCTIAIERNIIYIVTLLFPLIPTSFCYYGTIILSLFFLTNSVELAKANRNVYVEMLLCVKY